MSRKFIAAAACFTLLLLLFPSPSRAEWPLQRPVSAKLPACTVSETKLREVFHHTPGSEKYDVLYYSPNDREQIADVKKYRRRAVAYGLKTGEQRTEFWQNFADFIQIKCLPTRFRFTYIGKRRYIEYRTGEKAWAE